MADSLGSLCDKLSIVNIKLYHVQDKVHAAYASLGGLDAATTQQLVALNRERTTLVGEIDRYLDQAIKAGSAEVAPIIKIY